MSTEAIRPSTLHGLKQLAVTIKRRDGIPHARALDAAARACGHQNYQHALRVLSASPKRNVFAVHVTVRWRDRATRESGRETVSLDLPRALDELATEAQVRRSPYCRDMQLAAPDHLVQASTASGQDEARRNACKAARVLQLIGATGLVPSSSRSRIYPGGRFTNAVPGTDHATAWVEPNTSVYVYLDEPYEGAAEYRRLEREAWAERHVQVIVKPAWRGVYNPHGGTECFLIAPAAAEADLRRMAAALDKLPPVTDREWTGISAAASLSFVTPGERSAAAARAQAVRPKPVATSGRTVGYVQTLVGPRRRPDARLPLNTHAEIGRILKQGLAATRSHPGVYKRLNSVRSDLDEWVQREYSREELPDPVFFELYYREDAAQVSALRSSELGRAGDLLRAGYPDCAPLRAILKRLEAAQLALR